MTEQLVEEIWDRARIVSEDDRETWRVDHLGSPMMRREFQNQESPYGWVAQRIRKKEGPLESAANFRAVLWKNVRSGL